MVLRDGDEYAVSQLRLTQYSFLSRKVDLLFGHVLAVNQYFRDFVLVEVV